MNIMSSHSIYTNIYASCNYYTRQFSNVISEIFYVILTFCKLYFLQLDIDLPRVSTRGY